MAHSVD